MESDDQVSTPILDSIADLSTSLVPIWGELLAFLQSLILPGWRQYQILILVGLLLGALCLRFLTQKSIQNWARTRIGWPKWRLRLIVQVLRRLTLIYFALGTWGVYMVMQEITWPSRSYFIGLVSTLSVVWLVIGFASPLIHNRLLRRVVSWSLWIYATLYYLTVVDEVSGFLDNIALEIGGFRLSLMIIVRAAVVIAMLSIIARLTSHVVAGMIRRNDDISPSMQVLAIKALQVAVYGIAFFVAIDATGIDLTGLAVLSGAIGVGIGFGLQKVVSNLVSGVIILLDKSIKPGDVMSLGETFGWINSLGARYVSVLTRDGKEYLIPNEDLITGQVVNWSHSNEFVRLDIYFGTSYGCDPHLVRKLAVEATQGVSRVLSDPRTPVCHIVGFGDSSVDYILRFWISDPTGGLTNIRGNVYLALWDIFKANNISIPFPQREVRMLCNENGEVLAD
ncbi:MAG: mechanosensitive ion channel domain-containing protein [Paracoccaceae bacterium]